MSKAPRKPPLVLDMDFSETLTRFALTDPKESADNVILKKKGASKAPKSRVSKPKT